jgi:hypothetical protein
LPLLLLQVSGFTVSRPGFGSIRWLPPVDVRGLRLDGIVTIGAGEPSNWSQLGAYPQAAERAALLEVT